MSNPGPVVYPQNNGSTNPDGSFNPTGSANGTTTDPNSTHTDIYGLTPEQEQWTFYLGETGILKPTPAQIRAQARLGKANPNDKMGYSQPTYRSAIDLMKYYSALGTSPNASDRQQFANMQQQLLAIGAYGTSGAVSSYRPGVWTDLDAKALLKAFQSYQQVAGKDGAGQPLTFSEYIDQASSQSAANGQGGGAGGAGGGLPSRPTLTDPDTLRLYAQKAAQAALGRNLTPDQVDAFVNQFHSEQQASFNDALKGQGAVTDKSDPRAAAIQYVASNNPQEAGAHQVIGYTDALLNSMLSGSHQLPTPNVDPTAVTY